MAAFHLHYDSILGYAFRMTGDRDEAEDVTSQVFLSLAELAQSGRYPPAVRPWLFRAAFNAIVSLSRRRKTRGSTAADVCRWLTGQHAPAIQTKLHEASLLGAIRVGLLRLSLEDRQVIVLRFDEELEFAVIAEILGLTEGAVRSRLSRALARLRQIVKEMGHNA